MRYLLIHDTRSVGLLTAAVLTRMLRRSDHEVEVFFDKEQTRKAQDFWERTAGTLNLSFFDQIVLCCITYYEKNPEVCLSQLKRFESETGRPPLILSHRWPDGFQAAGYDVDVPPFDILDQYASLLEPADRELLRLSLVISRQADPSLVSAADMKFADRLGTAIWKDLNANWKSLTIDPATVLQKLRDDETIGQGEPLAKKGKWDSINERYGLCYLDVSARGHAEKFLEALLENAGENLPAQPPLAIGVLNDEGDIRVHLVRPWVDNLPSIEYLLENYAQDFNLPPNEQWSGPQDAKTLRFKWRGLNPEQLPVMVSDLQSFADWAFKNTTGERRPVAGLTHLIHLSALDALAKLDLTKSYTQGSQPSLRFDPLRTRILIDYSNRSGERRLTLLLRLMADTAKAASFMFGNDGYNLSKLERLLEGVLLGMGSQHSLWLESFSLPDRLRVDVTVDGRAIADLPEALRVNSEVRSVPVDEATQLGILKKESIIYRALTKYKSEKPTGIIIHRESETIGPSVPYALTVGAFAEALSRECVNGVTVLDVFSGSGLAARAILARQSHSRVICVDRTISARIAGLDQHGNVGWYKDDVLEFIAHDKLPCDIDLIAMDPPHGALFDLLFQKSNQSTSTLLDRLSALAPWLVAYQGHVSQVGRAALLQSALRQRFKEVKLWRIGPEVITIAGPEQWNDVPFDEIVSHTKGSLELECRKYDLDLREVHL